MLTLSKFVGSKIFRNNTGVGWQGQTKTTTSGDKLIIDPRPLHAGLCVGSSDLIGWTPVVITESMVGKKVAVFTAIEVKKPSGKASPSQLNFIHQVSIDGGIAGIAKNEDEALALVKYKLGIND